MDDLQSMVDSLRLGAESNDGRQMDSLAELLKGKLGLDLDQDAYRSLAESMVNLSLDKSVTTNNIPPPRSMSEHGTTHSKPHNFPFAPHPNSSFSNPSTSSFVVANQTSGNTGNQQQYAPNPGDSGFSSSHHSSVPPSSDGTERRRGRSPPRSNSYNNNSRSSPMRQVFGGIPRGSGQTVSNAPATTKVNTMESKRTLSPAPSSSTYGLYRRTKMNEEKKDNDREKGDAYLTSGGFGLGSMTSSNSLDQLASGSQTLEQISSSRQRMDVASTGQLRTDNNLGGNAPQRPSRPIGPTTQGPRGRSRSPHPSFILTNPNNFTPIPPSSPGVHNNAMRHSAPNSPMNGNFGAPTASERPPSRCGSPFNRPGLQEFDGNNETIASRSPKRDTMSNLSGVSSHRPGVPLGHRRARSIGVDADLESSQQPQVPRSFSKSPLRRPSAAPEQDSDSIRQPAPPRSFSHSPRRDHRHLRKADSMDAEFEDSDSIVMPDLSLPEFDSATSTPARYRARDSDTKMDLESVGTRNVYEVVNQKHRRIDNVSNTSRQVPQESKVMSNEEGVAIEMNFGNRPNLKFQRIPIRRSYGTRNEVHPVETRNEPSLSPPADMRDKIFSPMEVEFHPNEDVQDNRVIPPPRLHGRESPHFRHPSLDSHEQETMESIAPVLHGNLFSEGNDKTPVPSIHSPSNIKRNTDYSAVAALINNKRDEARQSYISGDYGSSINAYTDALKIASTNADAVDNDTISLLLSNRAAALLMVGAFNASVFDCQIALQKLGTQHYTSDNFSADSGLLLKVKLFTRMGRALLKLGDYKEAFTSFEQAVKTTEEAMAISRANHAPEAITQNQVTLSQMQTEAILGQSDSRRLHEAFDKLSKFQPSNDRVKYSEALGCVNMALAMASGSVELSETKLSILANMKRWREVAGFCERLAAFNVRLDNIFREDLATWNPFPGIAPAVMLKSNFFSSSRDEDAATRDLRLNSKAAGEAILRLPFSIATYYLRALRLEERYPAADSSLRALESHVQALPAHLDLGSRLQWIERERNKLSRTKQGRERGDELFRTGDFELAAAQYTTCLTIDGEGLPPPVEGVNAGGRLHAVLHCNRAACLMASKLFHAAIEEVSAALKIHPRYMKAILRRARCYARLQQIQESIAEYKRWLDLVDEASKPNHAATVPMPCLFDGPSEVKPAEVTQVKKELDDIYQAKRVAEIASREEADRRREREKWQENFSSSWRATSGDAQQRRDQWQQDTGRRWDPFKSEGPRSQSQGRSRSQNESSNHNPSSSHHRSASTSHADKLFDHYSVLNLQPTAKMEDVKKSFRKLAVKYHPDKNKDECATENFLRIKLAHDTLSDPVKRMQYDKDLRKSGRI